MKSMRAGNPDSAHGSGGNGGSVGDSNGDGEIPPGLLEALGLALNDDEFKKTLEQIGKQLGKDQGQVCESMKKTVFIFLMILEVFFFFRRVGVFVVYRVYRQCVGATSV